MITSASLFAASVLALGLLAYWRVAVLASAAAWVVGGALPADLGTASLCWVTFAQVVGALAISVAARQHAFPPRRCARSARPSPIQA